MAMRCLGGGCFEPRGTATDCDVPIEFAHDPQSRQRGIGHQQRADQFYCTAFQGHRNTQHIVRYTELASDRFKSFWRD